MVSNPVPEHIKYRAEVLKILGIALCVPFGKMVLLAFIENNISLLFSWSFLGSVLLIYIGSCMIEGGYTSMEKYNKESSNV